jgi:APA family basic amino acid/polyamine antiporter
LLCFHQLHYAETRTNRSLKGKEDVMGIAANYMFGTTFGKIVNVFIALQLVATISGYLWVGSRITQATASENKLWSFLAIKNKKIFR